MATYKVSQDLQALIELLELNVLRIRPSTYQGIELVLSWNPDYRVITVVGSGIEYFLYSKHSFPGARYDGVSDWVLTI